MKENIHMGVPTQAKWYLISLYFALCGLTTVGYAHHIEEIAMIILMFIGFILMVGAFMGGWTTVQVEMYRRHATFANRVKLISNSMVFYFLSNKINLTVILIEPQKNHINFKAKSDQSLRNLLAEVRRD